MMAHVTPGVFQIDAAAPRVRKELAGVLMRVFIYTHIGCMVRNLNGVVGYDQDVLSTETGFRS